MARLPAPRRVCGGQKTGHRPVSTAEKISTAGHHLVRGLDSSRDAYALLGIEGACAEAGYTAAQSAALSVSVDLYGVITELGLHRPAVVGHSMGGGTALALAGLYPDAPGAILLEDAAPLGLADMHMPHDPSRHARIMESIASRQSKPREQLIAEQRAATPMWSEVTLGLWADANLRLSPKATDFDPTVAVDWPVVLRRITCPALLIAADPDRGGMITAESAAAFRSFVPQLRSITIAGAGHCVRYEQFGRYMDMLRGFLAGVTAVT